MANKMIAVLVHPYLSNLFSDLKKLRLFNQVNE